MLLGACDVVKSSVVTGSVEGANVVAAIVVSTTVVAANVVGLAVVTASVVGDTVLDTVPLDISQLTPEKPVRRPCVTKANTQHLMLVNCMLVSSCSA